MKKFLLVPLIATSACANPPQQVAPGYQTASAIGDDAASSAYSPPKEYQNNSPAAANEGLFLGDDAAKQPAEMKSADGLGVYKLTSQGYQYYVYKGEGTNQTTAATSWFGQPGANGQFAITQGTYDTAAKTYSFASSPSLVMQKQPSTASNGAADASAAANVSPIWTGNWQQYDPTKKTYQPLAAQQNSLYNQTVTYNPTNNSNPYLLTLQPKDQSLNNLAIKYNGIYPDNNPLIYSQGNAVPLQGKNPFVFNAIDQNTPVTTQYLNKVYQNINSVQPTSIQTQIANFQNNGPN